MGSTTILFHGAQMLCIWEYAEAAAVMSICTHYGTVHVHYVLQHETKLMPVSLAKSQDRMPLAAAQREHVTTHFG